MVRYLLLIILCANFWGCSPVGDENLNYTKAYELYQENQDSSLQYIRIQIPIISDDATIAQLAYLGGYICTNKLEYREAISLFKLAVDHQNNNETKAILHSAIGHCYHKLYAYEKSINHYLTSLELDDVSRTYYDLGVVYRDIGDYKVGQEYLNEAIIRFQKADDFKMLAWSFNELGILFRRNKIYDIAREYYETVYLLSQKHNLEREAQALTNIGNTYYNEGDLEKALNFFERSLRFNYNLQDRVPALRRVGDIAYSKGNLEQAMAAYRELIKINTDYLDMEDYQHAISTLAKLHNSNGNRDSTAYYIDFIEKVSVSISKQKEGKSVDLLIYENEKLKTHIVNENPSVSVLLMCIIVILFLTLIFGLPYVDDKVKALILMNIKRSGLTSASYSIVMSEKK